MTGADDRGSDTLGRPRCLRIIENLRQGTDCLEGVASFSAGRGTLLRAASDLFAELEISDGAVVRWVRGRTGQGKTHFFARLIEMAHARNWVTSYVQISGRGLGAELHHFEGVYAAIVRNCLCRDLVIEEEGRIEPGRVPGWGWILDNWYAALRRQVVGRGTGEVPSFRLLDAINQNVTALRRRWSIHTAFAEALRQFALAKMDGDEDWCDRLRGWFRGENVHARRDDASARLRELGIQESLNRRNAKDMLRSMSSFLRYRGFAGILILMDELENVLHQPPAARRTGYTILRELIDNVDDRHGMTNAAFYLSATPDVFDSPKGITEYEALAERVLLPGGKHSTSPAASVVDLAAWPLKAEDLAKVIRRIGDLHGIARDWTPGPRFADRLQELLADALKRDPELSARSWVKTVVDELDNLHACRPD